MASQSIPSPDLRYCGVCWGKNGVRHYCDEPLGHGKDGAPHKCHCGATMPLIKKLAVKEEAK